MNPLLRRVLGAGAALGLVAALATAAGLWWLQGYLDRPLAVPDEGAVVEVVPGQGLGGFARRLHARGALDHPRAWLAWARWRGLDQRVQAGEYRLEAGLTPRTLMDRLVRGDVLLHALTVVEGWRFDEMLQVLRLHPAVRSTGLSAAEILAELDSPHEHPEGLFFPDTYRFARGTTDLELLSQAYRLMQRHLDEAWQTRQVGLPLDDPYEALVLASIIEKETALDRERERIAGVFVRRLQQNMRLQTDPTVIYGLGPDFEGRLRRVHLTTDTPYNTYTRHGLPPTPIALPGRRSLQAAVNPADGEELFFVATGLPDGSHDFSVTLDEHNRAVERYLERLREGRAE